MKILFTGFTSRTIGSDRNVYDYLCNVDVLRRVLERAGHEVDQRPVSVITDPCVEEDYDCALVGVAAMQGLSSRYRLGGLWTLHRFGKRAGIFPSDGKNVGVFPSSVQTATYRGLHSCGPFPAYLLGEGLKERNTIVEHEHGELIRNELADVLERLPQTDKLRCEFPILVPVHPWGRAGAFGSAWGGQATGWDPTQVAVEMQFGTKFEAHFDGRFMWARDVQERQRRWVLSSLQDNTPWVKKIKPTWPVLVVGNKRMAKLGTAIEYVPEWELINTYYRTSWGHLAFSYPLAEGGWWRMRYIHAALAGCVSLPGELDAAVMPRAFKYSRWDVERANDERLAAIALEQHEAIRSTAWSVDRAVDTVNNFVKGLVACPASSTC